MTVFLTILKVVGWIVLTLLVLVLLSIFLVLCVPIRYRMAGKKNGEFSLNARFSWLLCLVRVVVFTEGESLAAELRVLFFRKRIYPSEIRQMEDDGIAVLEEFEDETAEDFSQESDPVKEAKSPGEDEEAREGGSRRDGHAKEQAGAGNREAKRSPFAGIQGMFREIWGKLNDSKRFGKRWKKMLTDKKNRQAVMHLKKELFFLLNRLTPSRMRLTAAFSTGAPDTTGQLLGVISLFPAAYQNRWQITPDFMADEAYLTFDADIKGRFFLFHAAGVGLRIFFDSNCRRLFALLRR